MTTQDIYLLDYLQLSFKTLSISYLQRDASVERRIDAEGLVEYIFKSNFHNKVKASQKYPLIDEILNLIEALRSHPLTSEEKKNNPNSFKSFVLDSKRPADVSFPAKYEFLNTLRCRKESSARVEQILRTSFHKGHELIIDDLSLPEKNSIIIFNRKYMGELHEVFEYSVTDLYNCGIRVEMINDKKVLLPFIYPSGSSSCYYFDRFAKRIPLFNQTLISKYTDHVVLTDCLELANFNHLNNVERLYVYEGIDTELKSSLVWTSWIDRAYAENTLDKVNWSALSGQNVYYLLIQHSGNSINQTLNKGLEIYDRIKDISKSFKFVSYLHNFVSPSPDVFPRRLTPELLTIEELTEKRSVPLTKGAQQLPSYQSIFNKGSEDLFKPLIKKKSLSIIYNPKQSMEQSYLAMKIAVALAQNGKVFADWRSKGKCSVIYFTASLSCKDANNILHRCLDKTKEHMPIEVISAEEQNQSINSLMDIYRRVIMIDSFPHNSNKVIIIDDLSLNKFASNTVDYLQLNAFYKEMSTIGWSVLLCGDGSPASINELRKKVDFTSVVQTDNVSYSSLEWKLSIKLVEHRFKVVAHKNKFEIKLRHNTGYLDWTIVKKDKLDEFEVIAEVYKQRKKKCKISDIAANLETSVATVNRAIKKFKGTEALLDPITKKSYCLKQNSSYLEIPYQHFANLIAVRGSLPDTFKSDYPTPY